MAGVPSTWIKSGFYKNEVIFYHLIEVKSDLKGFKKYISSKKIKGCRHYFYLSDSVKISCYSHCNLHGYYENNIHYKLFFPEKNLKNIKFIEEWAKQTIAQFIKNAK